jgi:hypothetical protein
MTLRAEVPGTNHPARQLPPAGRGHTTGGQPPRGVAMTTTNANQLEAHLQRTLLYADRLFLALEEIEAAGGLAPTLAGRRPASREEVLARLRSVRDQLAAALGPFDRAPPRPARPPLLRRRANRPPPRTS